MRSLWPQLRHATDVVTCGGLQSAHTTAVAAACAEHGIRAHLLVRGERPAVPTGRKGLDGRGLLTRGPFRRVTSAVVGCCGPLFSCLAWVLQYACFHVWPAGHHLYTRMLGTVQYVSRAEYADRQATMDSYVERLQQQGGRERVGMESVVGS